ncbi:MAG: hypothetical protein IKV27_07240 [Lachnospiraceae bacterium]|nr:hypothetical protein [Lachnospiraceae bacterium]
MIDLKKACTIVCAQNKGMKPISCVELEKYYSFNMVPSKLKDGDGFANSSVYLVDKKTGEHKVVYFTLVVNKPILREFDKSDLEF